MFCRYIDCMYYITIAAAASAATTNTNTNTNTHTDTVAITVFMFFFIPVVRVSLVNCLCSEVLGSYLIFEAIRLD